MVKSLGTGSITVYFLFATGSLITRDSLQCNSAEAIPMTSGTSESSAQADIRPLLIAGGRSTRMGTAKHLLRWINDRPLYQHSLEKLHGACPASDTLYISLRDVGQWLELKDSSLGSTRIQPIYDSTGLVSQVEPSNSNNESNGPAAGLLAAYNFSPTTTWLIAGCDYPLLTTAALQQLVKEYVPAVTCFSNSKGWCEPLLAIWSPAALQQLQENVLRGRSGPSCVIQSLGGKVIRPKEEDWIFGANTKQEWNVAMQMARKRKTG